MVKVKVKVKEMETVKVMELVMETGKVMELVKGTVKAMGEARSSQDVKWIAYRIPP
jgi:hypothetical protein